MSSGTQPLDRLCEHDSMAARKSPAMRLDEVDQDALRELIDRSVRVRKGIDRASG